MLEVSKEIVNLDEQDIADNLLYYDYNVKHLLALKRKGVRAAEIINYPIMRRISAQIQGADEGAYH